MTDKITVGCDPEFFVQPIPPSSRLASPVNDLPDNVVPICGMIGGTKESPLRIKDLDEGFAVQEDGIACEFNIPPTDSALEFSSSVTTALHKLFNQLKSKGLTSSSVKTVELKPTWINSKPELLLIGCDPDFCAYDKFECPRELDHSKIKQFRGAGGHVHIGYNTQICPPKIVAQLLDTVLAIPTLEDDSQGGRRAWWGDGGVYRPKAYGVEYRTLSNFWIWSASSAAMVAAHAIALIEGLQNKQVAWQAFWQATNWDKVRNTILMEDHRAARNLFSIFREHKCYDSMLVRAQELMRVPKKKIDPPLQFIGGANG